MPSQRDLVFSPKFNSHERDIIHKEVLERDLRMSLCGTGTKVKQHMIVYPRRTALELVEHIRACGGETLRYILLEPKGIISSLLDCAVYFNILSSL